MRDTRHTYARRDSKRTAHAKRATVARKRARAAKLAARGAR